jgi:hypothetical protein
MSIGDRAYRLVVPPAARQLAEDNQLGEANWFIRAPESTPYFPGSVRSFIRDAAALSNGGSHTGGGSNGGTPSNSEIAASDG